MVLNTEKKQIVVGMGKEVNRDHQTKDVRGRNKSMKKENPTTIDVERLLSTYDLSKNALATLFPTPFSLDPLMALMKKKMRKKRKKSKKKKRRKKIL